MTTLAEKLNFSQNSESSTSIKIDNRKDVNFYETLCLYCTWNDIDLNDVSDEDFNSAVMTMENYGAAGKGSYNFWIDA